MGTILANLKGELHRGPFLKHLLNQANAWANLNELLKLETFQHGNDKPFVTNKNFLMYHLQTIPNKPRV